MKSSGNKGGNWCIWYCRKCVKRQEIVWAWHLSRRWTEGLPKVCLILGRIWGLWCIFARSYWFTYTLTRTMQLVIIIIVIIIVIIIINIICDCIYSTGPLGLKCLRGHICIASSYYNHPGRITLPRFFFFKYFLCLSKMAVSLYYAVCFVLIPRKLFFFLYYRAVYNVCKQ